MRAIAEAAGVSPGLVIHHFGSKDGLRKACDDYVAEEIRSEKSQAIQSTDAATWQAQVAEIESYAPLMAYLVRLVTPPDGIVLDPFMGSGSTGVACMREGMRFVGIERDTDADGTSLGYLAIAQARIAQASRQGHQMDISALFESENP